MTNVWQTWDERIVDLHKVSHQHLSNIYYYVNFIMAEYYPQSIRDYIEVILEFRFKGKKLPYKPDPNFREEWDRLRSMGWLRPNGDIIFNQFGSQTHIKLN